MPLDIGYKSTFKPEDVREEFFLPSKIETIDSAFTEFVDENLNIMGVRSKPSPQKIL